MTTDHDTISCVFMHRSAREIVRYAICVVNTTQMAA